MLRLSAFAVLLFFTTCKKNYSKEGNEPVVIPTAVQALIDEDKNNCYCKQYVAVVVLDGHNYYVFLVDNYMCDTIPPDFFDENGTKLDHSDGRYDVLVKQLSPTNKRVWQCGQ